MNSQTDRTRPLKSDRKKPNWEGFWWFGQSQSQRPQEKKDQLLAKIISSNPDNDGQSKALFDLSQAKAGDRLKIVSLNCDESNQRLMGMGLMPGVEVEIVSATGTGSVIVRLQNHRLGLGAEMAKQMQVTLANATIAIPETTNKTNISMNTTSNNSSSENSRYKLREAAIGSTLKVIAYEPGKSDYKRKLLAMGLIPGTQFVVKRHAPLGDPTEIEVRGFRLSLRKVEADALIVELV